MTTTITVKTHAWPVLVTTTDAFEREQTSGGVTQHVVSQVDTSEEVPPNSERSFHITNTRSISFDELELPVR